MAERKELCEQKRQPSGPCAVLVQAPRWHTCSRKLRCVTVLDMQVLRQALKTPDSLCRRMLLQRYWPLTLCPCQRSWIPA